MAVGVVLIVVGVILLLDSLGVLRGVGFEELWPLILIALGVMIIWERVRRSMRRR